MTTKSNPYLYGTALTAEDVYKFGSVNLAYRRVQQEWAVFTKDGQGQTYSFPEEDWEVKVKFVRKVKTPKTRNEVVVVPDDWTAQKVQDIIDERVASA